MKNKTAYNNLLKIDPVTKSLAFIFLTFLLLFLISYSSFFQIPVVVGEDLVWQSIVEQFTTWILFIPAFIYLFKSIRKKSKKKKNIFNENKYSIPVFVLIFIAGISIGTHLTAQIIEDSLINHQETFSYKLTYFLDEQIGHLFIVPLIILIFILMILEINRKKPKLKLVEIWFINILAVLTAFVVGILMVEAGIIYFTIIPLVIIFFFKLLKKTNTMKINIFLYPLNRYILIICPLIIIFSLIWLGLNGFSQPEELGLKLFNF